jgi:hypothetical protein
LTQLPVGKDLPRLCRNFVVYDEYNLPMTNRTDTSLNDTQQTILLLHSIFVSLANVLDEFSNLKSMDTENFGDLINPGDFTTINDFILKNFGENGKTTMLLKSCNQSAMAPAITQLKKALLRKIQYKDVQGFPIKFLIFFFRRLES